MKTPLLESVLPRPWFVGYTTAHALGFYTTCSSRTWNNYLEPPPAKHTAGTKTSKYYIRPQALRASAWYVPKKEKPLGLLANGSPLPSKWVFLMFLPIQHAPELPQPCALRKPHDLASITRLDKLNSVRLSP